ncbi:MAG TPA: serine/threonine-protein kinase [Acidimicrobiales bacterium]|nr:serine/threonine-protein kinase [Acidimicrobiales bacterium]
MGYEKIARLGRGGMGVVDLARDENGTRVALKRLTLHGSASEILQARQRLLREASVLRRLHHPNVVRLLDVVEEDDEIVLVMPYLPGGNLSERVAQHGPAPAEEVDRLGQRLLGALAEAHAAGVIHRDVKPANVLFDERGDPCLADFGLAHTWDQTQGLTVTGMVVGTPGFMSPEQTRDEQLTPASDIFSLGATLLFAATNTGPFGTGDPGLLMVRAAGGKIEKVPKSVPASLRRRLQAMLDPRPERRPTAVELLNRRGDVPRRSRLAFVGGAAGFVLVAGLAFAATRDGAGDGVAGGSVQPSDGGATTAAPTTKPTTAPSGTGGAVDPGEPAALPDGRDERDNQPLVDEIEAVVSPADTVDRYPLPLAPVGGPCPTEIQVVLTAPPGATMRLEIYHDDSVLDAVDSAGGVPAALVLHPGNCTDDVGVFSAVVTPLAPLRDDTPYVLNRLDR